MEEDLKCCKCNSSQTSFRVKTHDRICYKCGNISKIKLVRKSSGGHY